MNSEEYKRLQEGGEGKVGGKEYTITQIYNQFKDLAYQDMIQKYPEAKKAIDQKIEERIDLLKVKDSEVKQKKINK
jgi:hypothetical protein